MRPAALLLLVMLAAIARGNSNSSSTCCMCAHAFSRCCTVCLPCLAAGLLLEVQHQAPCVASKLLLLGVQLQWLLQALLLLLLHLLLSYRRLLLLLLLLLTLLVRLCTNCSVRCSHSRTPCAAVPALLACVLVIIAIIPVSSSLCLRTACSAVWCCIRPFLGLLLGALALPKHVGAKADSSCCSC
jgi:hypothetical protein